ncbi:IS110 family transposase [Spirosoma endbachense]|uniref:IS110 family transposase n=1 Tax=Spirosoma endbachense TaxID=2666025 RepID=UPI0021D1B73E|nr:transposase [Spirosoma endbachense]
MTSFLRYCVGLDISKDTLQVCLSVMESTGRVTVKGTTKLPNKSTGFATLITWVARHRKLDLPLTYLMESTGVYHEAVAWYLHQQDQPVSILLPNKAKYYLKSLGYNRAAGAVQERQNRRPRFVPHGSGTATAGLETAV